MTHVSASTVCTGTNLGKEKRLRRLFSPYTRRSIVVPLDDGLIVGPLNGLQDLRRVTAELKRSAANAVLAFPGTLRAQFTNLDQLGWIMNVTASTTRSNHTRKVLVGSVEQAVRWAADAIAVHVNITDKHESEMLENLGVVVRESERMQLPVLAIMYPRQVGPNGDNNFDALRNDNLSEYAKLVAHSCRVGVELGADVIKTQYTGDPDSFRTVIEAACGIPVVVAGGPQVERELALQRAKDAIAAGAAGISFGRNVYQRADIRQFLDDLGEVVHSRSLRVSGDFKED